MATFKLAFGDGDPEGLAARLREAIDVGPYDEVEIVTPQFVRTDGKRIVYYPSTPEQYDQLKTLSDDMLKEIGLQPWDENGLWLFPGEWYNYIPDGYEVTDIFGNAEPFKKGMADDDIRFGALAYGIMKQGAQMPEGRT